MPDLLATVNGVTLIPFLILWVAAAVALLSEAADNE